MRRTHIGRLFSTAGVTLVVLAALLVGARPALAMDYPSSLDINWIRVSTDNCQRLAGEGSFRIERWGDDCVLRDDGDDTMFLHDDGGVALKVELYVGGDLVGKIEFHPYGEVFWFYDTASDGETFYVDVCWESGTTCVPDLNDEQARNNPPNTKNRVYPEGARVVVNVYDDPGDVDGHSHLLTSFGIA
jgi:hypothetical protein